MGKVRVVLLLAMMLLALAGCDTRKEAQEREKWRVNPDRENKRPYGTWLAYNSLKYYFTGATVNVLPKTFRYANMDNKMRYNSTGRSLLILQGFDFRVSPQEWTALKEFINDGNELVVFCNRLDDKISEELGCYRSENLIEQRLQPDSLLAKSNEHILRLSSLPFLTYGYKGRSLKGYFDIRPDTSGDDTDRTINYFSVRPDTLGYAGTEPDFVRYALGEGHLTLHAAPLVLSNYFLLQDGNVQYLTGIWKTLPDGITRVYWNDYFSRTVESPGLGLLFRYPATRYALLLGIFALMIYVLFESKRKQRVIPIIPPLKNDSVSFVETVGRLYYNKGDHANLAGKMTWQFLEWVRTHYFLNTNLLNEDFVKLLTMKSGQQETTVRALMDMIHEIRLGTAYIDDAYLYQLYNTTQQFYKNNRT